MNTRSPHDRQPSVFLDADGVAWVGDTDTKVLDIARLFRQGETLEYIQSRHRHLSTAQVYEAIAYYSEHREEIEKELGPEQPDGPQGSSVLIFGTAASAGTLASM
jgi:uncharacterized protein (DUF433 family)